METFERLPETVSGACFTGVGIPNLSAKLVKRTEKKAMYYRWDNVWEVFRIKIKEESSVFGRTYPRREAYPNNESFGVWAWAYSNEGEANKCYNSIPDSYVTATEDTSDESDT